jgi:predicted cation transporter
VQSCAVAMNLQNLFMPVSCVVVNRVNVTFYYVIQVVVVYVVNIVKLVSREFSAFSVTAVVLKLIAEMCF